ncbi:MAG TPA: class I SAM-dependent methyltransferase [Actinomycetota bacterium]|nr:class I SAM-dependent methyltransferase [Actinomycetota bacterium]
MRLRENEIGARLAPHLAPGMEVLDLGAGTGRIARWLAERVGVRPTLADVADFSNRVADLPFLPLPDPLRVPAPDRSFDAVLLLFVLHHIPRWADQGRVVAEAARVARRRVVVIEDTPTSRLDRAVNVAWDWALNLRHGVPTPFTFRTVEGWRGVFARAGLDVAASSTYRARWPTLATYHHTLFVLEAAGSSGPVPGGTATSR